MKNKLIAIIKGSGNDEKQSRTIPILITYNNLSGEELVSQYEFRWDAEKDEATAQLIRCGAPRIEKAMA